MVIVSGCCLESAAKLPIKNSSPSSEYTMQTLPKPNNPDVSLEEIAEKRFAVIRFSGLAKSKRLEKQARELEAFIQSQNLQVISKPTYAFFNPPWTLPFLRRNEVMIEIKR